ncbi:MAG: hypothetical protein AAF517_02495 [Planctomycetota bacterium]
MSSMRRAVCGSTLLGAAIVAVAATTLSRAGEELVEPAWFSMSPDLSDGPLKVNVHAPDGGIQGWSFSLCHDSSANQIQWFQASAELTTVRDGGPPNFIVTESSLAGDGVVQAVVLDFVQTVSIPSADPNGFPVLEASYDTDAEQTIVRVCSDLRGSGEPVPAQVTIDGATFLPKRTAETTVIPKPEAFFELHPKVSNGLVTAFINSVEGGIQGWSLSLCHDPDKVAVRRFGGTQEVMSIKHGSEPDFWWIEEANDGHQAGIIQAIVPAFAEYIELPGETDGGFPALEVEYEVFEESSITFCEALQGSGEPVELVVTVAGLTSRLPMQHATSTLIVDPYADTLTYRVEPPESSEVVTVKLYSEEAKVQGWAFSLCHTAAAADILEFQSSPELEQLVLGEAPEFVLNELQSIDPFGVMQQHVILGPTLSGEGALALGPFADGVSLLDIRYDVRTEDPLKFCDHVGTVTLDNYVTIEGVNYIPRNREGAVLVEGGLETEFIRGDSDLNGRVNLSDAVFILRALFQGHGPLPCEDAADVNDVARVDISDPIYLLRFLFLGGPEPPAPFPASGRDISPSTALGCEIGL